MIKGIMLFCLFYFSYLPITLACQKILSLDGTVKYKNEFYGDETPLWRAEVSIEEPTKIRQVTDNSNQDGEFTLNICLDVLDKTERKLLQPGMPLVLKVKTINSTPIIDFFRIETPSSGITGFPNPLVGSAIKVVVVSRNYYASKISFLEVNENQLGFDSALAAFGLKTDQGNIQVVNDLDNTIDAINANPNLFSMGVRENARAAIAKLGANEVYQSYAIDELTRYENNKSDNNLGSASLALTASSVSAGIPLDQTVRRYKRFIESADQANTGNKFIETQADINLFEKGSLF